MKPKVLLLCNHDNSWTPEDVIETDLDEQRALQALRLFGYESHKVKVYHSVAEALRPLRLDPREWLVFNWCEGYADRPWDYDGVTDELEQLGFAYTGSDTWTLRASKDKGRVQAILQHGNVSIPRGQIVRPGSPIEWSLFPAIVKPANQHGSYGIDSSAVVTNTRQLRQRVAYLREQFQSAALVEEFIDGREFQVTVWGNPQVDVLPEVEVVFGNELSWRDRIYTYQMKFDPAGPNRHHAGFVCPSMLTPLQRHAIAQTCRKAYRVMHCRDYARIDVRLRDDRVHVLDVNVNPDINSESLLVIAAEVAGLTYDEVVARIIELATERWRVVRTTTGVQRSRKREQPEVISKHV
jgi:D-alanine-D-alanine ligase